MMLASVSFGIGGKGNLAHLQVDITYRRKKTRGILTNWTTCHCVRLRIDSFESKRGFAAALQSIRMRQARNSKFCQGYFVDNDLTLVAGVLLKMGYSLCMGGFLLMVELVTSTAG